MTGGGKDRMEPDVRRYEDRERWLADAAELVCERAGAAIAASGRFSLVLSGGHTPRPLYERLASESVDWTRTHLFWGDERCVPPDESDSNFRMAFETLVSRVPVPGGNVHRIRGEMPPHAAAAGYEADLKAYQASAGGVGLVRFDVVLLGLGPDGHTASLFPGSPLLSIPERETSWVAAVEAPEMEPRVSRITLTLPVLNAAACVVFLLAGADKHERVERILSGGRRVEEQYPAARVRPRGDLVWLIQG